MRIEGCNLRYCRGEAAILDGIDVQVAPGRLVGLVGPNGAGKTSLLRVLAGLLAPSGGSLTYDGRPAQAVARRERARRLAYLAQGGTVHWPLRVEQLVALGRLPHGAGKEADRAAVERALAATGVAHLRRRPLDTLSGGERLRALLARALAVEPEILLADEPTAALDPYHQLQVMELLRAATARGLGVVLVLHDLTLAARFCDELLLLQGGRVLAAGPAPAVLTDENLAFAYGIAALRGNATGATFLLPWSRIDGG